MACKSSRVHCRRLKMVSVVHWHVPVSYISASNITLSFRYDTFFVTPCKFFENFLSLPDRHGSLTVGSLVWYGGQDPATDAIFDLPHWILHRIYNFKMQWNQDFPKYCLIQRIQICFKLEKRRKKQFFFLNIMCFLIFIFLVGDIWPQNAHICLCYKV